MKGIEDIGLFDASNETDGAFAQPSDESSRFGQRHKHNLVSKKVVNYCLDYKNSKDQYRWPVGDEFHL